MSSGGLHREVLRDFPKGITDRVETPCYLINEGLVKKNCEILDSVQLRTGAKILLALKAFALWSTFPLIRKYLHGVCASGPIEARLGREEFGREVHTCAPAYSGAGIDDVINYSDHIIFNSIYQWKKYRDRIKISSRAIEIGLRVNPGHSEVAVPLYNPCIPGSRFGIKPEDIEGEDLAGIDGLHFHALCEQNADVLGRVLASFEQHFARYIPRMKWVNFGGGHHITRIDYDLDTLCTTITDFRKRHNGIAVYLEPGEAVVLNSGVLVATVLDIVENDMAIAILDTSAEAHMPDVLAMPYRPNIIGAGNPGELPHTYRLGGITCLAGDVIGDYSFAESLKRGDRLVFLDMALYSFVKNTTFNGIRLPSLILYNPDNNSVRVVRRFGYADYKNRLS
ncbi:MAG TPA: carboxynorspermidine decarboxylase [Thermodesulfobacteriota bacterium]|nr:carboxynorspermidine decarboxylase [Thermodesulfobacteriota bacterium]